MKKLVYFELDLIIIIFLIRQLIKLKGRILCVNPIFYLCLKEEIVLLFVCLLLTSRFFLKLKIHCILFELKLNL